jgi:hypothetical protein
VVQIWPGLFVCKEVTACPGHIWTTLYILRPNTDLLRKIQRNWPTIALVYNTYIADTSDPNIKDSATVYTIQIRRYTKHTELNIMANGVVPKTLHKGFKLVNQ